MEEDVAWTKTSTGASLARAGDPELQGWQVRGTWEERWSGWQSRLGPQEQDLKLWVQDGNEIPNWGLDLSFLICQHMWFSNFEVFPIHQEEAMHIQVSKSPTQTSRIRISTGGAQTLHYRQAPPGPGIVMFLVV